MSAPDSNNNTAVCGVVVVDKPAGWTSFDVAAKLRGVYGTRAVGHTGTLDPMATGVLVVLVGRAAKAAEFVSAGRKVYEAGLRLGITTDTEDITGNVTSECGVIPDADAVEAAAREFVGGYMQTPPMYSAKKRGGEKLYQLARRGVTVERAPVRVEIYGIEVEKTERADEFSLTVSCSGGTYIRTLCADIGARLGCGGCMSRLRRTETGGFEIGAAHTIEEIISCPEACILPTETLFGSYRRVTVDADGERRLRCGQKIGCDGEDGERVSLYGDNGFFALGGISGGRLGTVRLFVL